MKTTLSTKDWQAGLVGCARSPGGGDIVGFVLAHTVIPVDGIQENQKLHLTYLDEPPQLGGHWAALSGTIPL